MGEIAIDRDTIEQAEFYLTAFGLSGLSKLKIAGEGRIATNYIAYPSDGGSYILRIYNLEQGRELGYGTARFEFEAKVLKYIEGRAPLATPALLSPARGCGQPYLKCGSAMIMLYKMLDGKCLEQSQLSTNVALQAGQCLHKFTDTFGNFQRTSDAPEGAFRILLTLRRS